MQQTTLQDDYRYCQKIIQQHSKSFYYAFSQLPKPKAEAVYAIYAFCRSVDDAVDTVPDHSQQIARLDQLEMELDLFRTEKEVDHPMWRALRDVFQRYDMNIDPFYDQIKGQRMDIDFTAPETLTDLEYYSAFVAGSVGLMLLPVIASETTADLKQNALSLGIAMQLTNILRDIGEDLKEINRIYLPKQLMAEEKYTEQALRNEEISPAFLAVWETLAQRAENLYDCFEDSIHHFDSESRLPVLTAANVYRGILDAVRSSGYQCFTKRQAVSPWQMQQISAHTQKQLQEKRRA